ncbi:thioredoxin [Candidatus Pacearchaeota archaeon]|nr:thioredoxin [Candidatus Pacearchaeota archaeon]
MTKSYTDLDAKKFDDFVKKGVAVIEFWAEWCGPCKIMGPVFEEVAEKTRGKTKFGKVNVDSNNEIAQKFGVMSIPTLIFFKDGEPVDRSVGVIDESNLKKRIERIR